MRNPELLTKEEFQKFSNYGLFKVNHEDLMIYHDIRKETARSIILTYPYGKLVEGKLKIYSAKFLREHPYRFMEDSKEPLDRFMEEG